MTENPDSSPASALVRRAVPAFESMLTGYAFNLTGDLEMARDVVQDTFSMEDSPVDHLPDPSPSPDHQAAAMDETAFVLNTFSRLPVNQAEVLRLKFQNDLSYQEIADVTGLSASNVGFLIHTGLKRLRTLLAPEAAACS